MSVEGKFLSKEINDLFWREGPDTRYCRELHGRKCGGRYYSRLRKFTILLKVELSLFQRNKGKSVRGKPRNFRNSRSCK